MELNKYSRESLIGKLCDLITQKKQTISIRDKYKSKEFADIERDYFDSLHVADPSPNQIEDNKLSLEAAKALITSWDIDIYLLDNNIDSIKEILTNNEF